MENGKYWSAMSLIRAEDSYCNACVENVKYRSAISFILAADGNGNAVEGDDKTDQLCH